MRTLILALLAVPALTLANPYDLPAPPPPPPELTSDLPAPLAYAFPRPAAGAVAPAHAAELAPPSAPVTAARRLPRFGLLLDVGAPDGANAALLYRLFPSVRLSLGAAHNGLGWGVQGGAGWTPIRWYVSPTLNVEAGHYFDADATWVADRVGGIPENLRPLLRRVGYHYASAQLGLELGSPRGFTFFVRAGLSYLDLTLRGTGGTGEGEPGETEVTLRDPSLRATLPSAKLGFLVWF